MATNDLTLDAGQLTAALTEPPPPHLPRDPREGEEASSSVIDVPEAGEVTIGRSRGAAIVVDHEKVSRLHARFRRYGDRLDVEDLESRNGTRVKRRQDRGHALALPGDEIAIGSATIFVGIASPTVRRTRVADAEAFEARLEAELDHAHRYRHRVALASLAFGGDCVVVEAMAPLAPARWTCAGDFGGDGSRCSCRASPTARPRPRSGG